jgi:D-threonine aldolase
VFIDLNVGMNRTGIVAGEEVLALAKRIYTLPGIVLRGVHAYDGHFRDADISMRKQKCDEAFLQVEYMLTRLQEEGFTELIIIAGGSPTFSIHCQREMVECSPGTFIYWDKGYGDLCAEQHFLPAAVLVTRVISFPANGRVTTDLGHKSVAAENEIGKRIYFQNVSGLMPVGQSEEHLVLERTEHHEMQVGQVLYGIPYHICPTVALYERVFTVQDGKVNGEWKTIARDRRIHF